MGFFYPIHLSFYAYTFRLPFHNACFALAVQVSDPRKIEQPLFYTSSMHVVALLQFAPTNPPYCWALRKYSQSIQAFLFLLVSWYNQPLLVL